MDLVIIAFIGGVFFGIGAIGLSLAYYSRPVNARHKYPKKTTRPEVINRVRGRPTNVDAEPTVVRKAIFRTRRSYER